MPEFAKLGGKIYAISVDSVANTKALQEEFPSLTLLSDAEFSAAESLDILTKNMGPPDLPDVFVPTTMVIKDGVVVWIYRAGSLNVRLPAADLLATATELWGS